MSFTIGRLASAAGVHVETVRYYERRGLLEQPARAAGGGYREYSDDDLWRLQFIARAKGLGFTLAEIGGLLSAGSSSAAVLAAARSKLDDVRAQEAALAVVRARLERLAEVCAGGADGDCEGLFVP
jgi:MerR family mercuric resistance operon transcriptional regulator